MSRVARILCAVLEHRIGHDYRGRPVCERCGLRFRYATGDEHAHNLRMQASRARGSS